MTSTNKQLIVLSGGIDSIVLAHKLKSEGIDIKAIYFDIGYLPRVAEMNAAKMAANMLDIPIEVVDVSGIHNMVAGHVPIEYLGLGELDKGQPTPIPTDTDYVVGFPVIIALATYYSLLAKIEVANVALIKEQIDQNKGVGTFLNQWDATVGPLNPKLTFKLLAPFSKTSKSDVINLGTSLKVDFKNSWSCHRKGTVHCGECSGCLSRKQGFSTASVSDPTTYIV